MPLDNVNDIDIGGVALSGLTRRQLKETIDSAQVILTQKDTLMSKKNVCPDCGAKEIGKRGLFAEGAELFCISCGATEFIWD
jgi:predicted RNA-binding Zn-ribbon protein involved in translation (DUF1610 family)